MLKSLLNKHWQIFEENIEYDSFFLKQLSFSLGVSDLVAKLLVHRGITNVSEGESLIDSKLKNLMPDPAKLIDLKKASLRLCEAIYQNQKIFIYGDYDVDGVSSTALLVRFLRQLGLDPSYYIPNRFKDGYGLNQNSYLLASQAKVGLFIVVDSGINSFDEVTFGNSLGIDSIILDHHMPNGALPPAFAVVNPNRIDQEEQGLSLIKNLSASGVCFLLLAALKKELKNSSFFEKKHLSEPDLKDYVSLAAMGTVCDVMPLQGFNRALVNFSLKYQRVPLAVLELLRQGGAGRLISSADDFGFTVGPALNAAGRLGDNLTAIEALLADDKGSSSKLAQALLNLNSLRKRIEKEVFQEALNFIKGQNLSDSSFLFVFGNNWHEGVIGIIAGKLKDIFNCPVFVASFNSEGKGKGSARSIEGIPLHEILAKAQQEGILEGGGGHALAGGFSLSFDQVSNFKNFLQKTISQKFESFLKIDLKVPSCIDLRQLVSEINRLEPCGKKVERPIFYMEKVRVENVKFSKDGNHLLLSIGSSFGSFFTAMLFGISSKESLAHFLTKSNEEFDLAFSIKQNPKYPPSVIIEDVRRRVND